MSVPIVAEAAMLAPEIFVSLMALALCSYGAGLTPRDGHDGPGTNASLVHPDDIPRNGTMPDAMPWVLEYDSLRCTAFIASLSLVVVFVRALLSKLGYLSGCVATLYDSLLCCLWALNMTLHASAAAQIIFQSEDVPCRSVFQLHPFGGDDGDTFTLAVYEISGLATILYSIRLILSIVEIVRCRKGTWLRRDDAEYAAVIDEEEQQVRRQEAAYAEKVYAEAYSPVLAFFPE